MEKNLIQEKLVDFVSANFSIDRDDIELNVSLVDQGIIDSMGLIEVSSYLEREHGISVVETDLNSRNFGSVEAIVDFVTAKCMKFEAESSEQIQISETGESDVASRASLQRLAIAKQHRAGK